MNVNEERLQRHDHQRWMERVGAIQPKFFLMWSSVFIKREVIFFLRVFLCMYTHATEEKK